MANENGAMAAAKELSGGLQRIEGTKGVILHGSYARGNATPTSDIDIVWITDNPLFSEAAHPMIISGKAGEFLVDVKCISVSEVAKTLVRPERGNNNLILNALMMGVILYQADHSLAALMNSAREVWKRGPDLPSQEEMYVGYVSICRPLARIKDLMKSTDPTSTGVARLLASTLFVHMLFGFCQTRRLWTAKVEYIIRGAQNEDPPLYELCVGYLNARTNDEIVESLEAFAAAIFAGDRERLRLADNTQVYDKLTAILSSVTGCEVQPCQARS